jgi:ATP-dependent Clp protease protease subunit
MAKTKQIDAQIISESNSQWLQVGIDLVSRRIHLSGPVDPSMAAAVTRGLIKMAEISKEPIELYLSSPGGDVYPALGIYDAVRSSPCDIIIYGLGEIMSAAFVIFLSGDYRYAAPNTTFMMHSLSFGSEGNVKEQVVSAREGVRVNELILTLMSQRTKRNKAWWKKQTISQDFYFTTKEASKIGALTKLLEE